MSFHKRQRHKTVNKSRKTDRTDGGGGMPCPAELLLVAIQEDGSC